MKKIILPIVLASTISMVGCQQKNYAPEDMRSESQYSKSMEMDMMAAPAPMVKMERSLTSGGDGTQTISANANTEMLLAYRYNFQFAIPVKNLESVSQKAIQTCKNAGVSKCRIVSSSLNKHSEDHISANIQLRVEPEWFETYRDGLNADSLAADGKLTNSNVSAEDLTIAISDSSAKLKSLTTLRTRLQNMLETKGSKLNDLIQVERELARVQGQIESSTARLRVLRTRVSMSQVSVNYQTTAVAASRSSFTPIKRAITDFVGIVAEGLAGVIRFIAFALPWLILILPALWLIRRWHRRRRVRKTEQA